MPSQHEPYRLRTPAPAAVERVHVYTGNSAITGSVTIVLKAAAIPTLSTWVFVLLVLTALRTMPSRRRF